MGMKEFKNLWKNNKDGFEIKKILEAIDYNPVERISDQLP